MAVRKTQPKLVTAKQARFKFMDDDFVQAIITLNEAILDAAVSDHKVTVNIPTGRRENGSCVAYLVAQRLRENGFEIVMIHDPENGSTELTVDWSKTVGNNEE
jgi:hypothetical protein